MCGSMENHPGLKARKVIGVFRQESWGLYLEIWPQGTGYILDRMPVYCWAQSHPYVCVVTH